MLGLLGTQVHWWTAAQAPNPHVKYLSVVLVPLLGKDVTKMGYRIMLGKVN
jgi:hypothetical protein